jgi:hypothetical protein
MLPRPSAWRTLAATAAPMAIAAFALERSWSLGGSDYLEPYQGVGIAAGISVFVALYMSNQTRWRPGRVGAVALLGAVFAGYFIGLGLQYVLARPGSGFLEWYDAKMRHYHFTNDALAGREMGARGYFRLSVLVLAFGVLFLGLDFRPFCPKCRRLKVRRVLEYVPAGPESEARVAALLGQSVAPPGLKLRRPGADRFVRVSHDLCESCGDSALKADWMERKGSKLIVTRTETRRLPT